MEERKPLKGYEETHEISTHGNCRRIKDGYNYSVRIKKSGYATFHINAKDILIHRAVALTFIENHENKPQVNHIDGNKLNNKLENLEWATRKENLNHALDSKLIIKRVQPIRLEGIKFELL